MTTMMATTSAGSLVRTTTTTARKKMVWVGIIFTLTVLGKCVDSAKILAIFPVPFKEHQLVYRPLIERLAEKGHDITLLTTDPIEDLRQLEVRDANGTASRVKPIRQIDLSFVYDLPILEDLNTAGLGERAMLRNVFNVMRKISDAELQHPAVQELIWGQERFDLVMVEWSGVSLMNAFAHHFHAPLVGITNGGAFINAHEALGNPNHPVGYPSIFMPFTEDLTLPQRISSVFFTIWYRFYYYTEEIPMQNAIAAANFGPNIPDLCEIERQADLLLINAYQALGIVRPVGPTTVYLGGIHRKQVAATATTTTTTTTLESSHPELEHFLQQHEAADESIVYINLDLDPVADHYRLEKVIRALEKLDTPVVWSWNHGQFVNASLRLFQGYNLPQEDILAHPGVKLFITNGGQRNIEDAIHHTVPLLGISYSSSLEHYLRQIVKYELGVISLIDFETQTTFAEKLVDALGFEMYEANMKRLNRLLADQPMDSLERATWWIEYVARNEGTKHLRAPQLSWFQYLMLDVTLTVLALASLLTALGAWLVYRAVCYSRSLPIEMVTRGSKKSKML